MPAVLRLLVAVVLAAGAGVGVGLAVSGGDDVAVTTTTSSTTSSTTTSTTVPPCAPEAVTARTRVDAEPSATAHLRSVEVTSSGGCDVVVFAFQARPDGTLAVPSVEVDYRPGPITEAPSDRPLPVPGDAFLFVRLFPASCHDVEAPGFPRTCATPDPFVPDGARHVLQARVVEDFEAQLTLVLGLPAERPFTVRSDPTGGTVTVTIT